MFTEPQLFMMAVILLSAGGVYMLIPHSHGQLKARTAYIAGAALGSFGLIGFLSLLSAPEGPISAIFFYLFSAVALGAAVMTITSRDPVYSALWFAAVVLSTSGLFVLAGAQFLAAGTVIVYAGAIIVTFLFVIMLAQMEGKAVYDRSARSPAAATATCFLLLGALLVCLVDPVFAPVDTADDNFGDQVVAETALPKGRELVARRKLHANHPIRVALENSMRPTSSIYTETSQEKPDVAGLGESLYADNLLAVELAGSLLFAALITAVAITNPKRPVRPGDPQPAGDSI